MTSGFDIGVAAAVVADSSILLVQEAKGTYAGCWGLPKGYVEPNESIEAAVLRELKEETNITGSISGFIGL
ncbi:MAG: NUDIX domain-containing protein, partial [Candidatus Thermoplasmatota archaeon]|nr:NUDIX domain-containing protein [Candidatus Thermoplasmatota archaeon]